MPPNEYDDILRKMSTKIDTMHTVLIGDEHGRGGMVERVENLEDSDDKQNKFMYRLSGGVALLAMLIGLLVKYVQ